MSLRGYSLLGYLRPQLRWLLLGPLCLLVEVAMDLALPRLMADLLDRGLAQQDFHSVCRSLLAMLACVAVGWFGGVGCTAFSMRAGISCATALREDLFAKILSLPLATLDGLQGGALLTSLTADIGHLQQFLILLIRGLLRSLLLLSGSVVMAFTIDRSAALILLALALLAFALLALLTRYSGRAFAAMQQGLDRLNAVLQANLAGIRTVKAFAHEQVEQRHFAALNRAYVRAAQRAWQLLALNTPVLLLLLNTALVAVLWIDGANVREGRLPAGELIALVNYMTIALAALSSLGMLLAQFARAQVAAQRVRRLFDLATEQEHTVRAVPSLRGAIAFERVSFAYAGQTDRPVLRDVSFTIQPGERVALVGWTGAGKSSLAALIARLYEPTAGSIRIDGCDIREFDAHALRARIGMVPQSVQLFSGSIRDNICLGRPQASDADVFAAARSAQIHAFIENLPQGYATQLGQRGVTLSGGQRQRLAIARALLRRPSLLILDDSSSALDGHTAAQLRLALRSELHGSTLLVIGQRPSALIDVDRILVLDEGRLVAQGTHDQLLRRSPVYRALCERQDLVAEKPAWEAGG